MPRGRKPRTPNSAGRYRCPRCGNWLPPSEFYEKPGRGLTTYCRPCNTEVCFERYQRRRLEKIGADAYASELEAEQKRLTLKRKILEGTT
jgi:hypothetical protein